MSELIERQAVINLWDKYRHTIAVDAMQYDAELRQLPPVQPEPCEDAVSREEVLNCLEWQYPDKLPRTKIMELPPVTPKQPEQGWIASQSDDIIRVDDEVEENVTWYPHNGGVVLSEVGENLLVVMTNDRQFITARRKDMKKTGRAFPQISSVVNVLITEEDTFPDTDRDYKHSIERDSAAFSWLQS